MDAGCKKVAKFTPYNIHLSASESPFKISPVVPKTSRKRIDRPKQKFSK